MNPGSIAIFDGSIHVGLPHFHIQQVLNLEVVAGEKFQKAALPIPNTCRFDGIGSTMGLNTIQLFNFG